ncbi:MAG: ribonuclease R [Gemmatimonadota bacterium]
MSVPPQKIVDYLRHHSDRPLKAKELARGLGVSTADYAEFRQQLRRLEDEGVLYRVKAQRYAVPRKINLVVGRVQTIRSGAAFVLPEDDGGPDVFIPSDRLTSALDGDRVVVRIERRKRGDRREGRVIRVLERARSTVVGVYHPKVNYGFVVPEDRKLPRDVFVPPGEHGGASNGDVVVVEVADWGDAHHGPSGSVREVLGRWGDPGVDVLAIIYGHELPLAFPAAVEAEAAAIEARGITAVDRKGRLDLTDRLIFTIDPADAKDHDDALSIRRVDDGWEVGVHIADVSHYVAPGSALDEEALRRGTSVYLVDRVVPMLPEALSADLCSLRPDVDRLAVSLLIDLDDRGAVRHHELRRTVICSRHRLSYDQVQEVIDGKGSIAPDTDQAIRGLVSLSRSLRTAREARGSLDFDLPQARVILNTQGEPTDIERVLRLESHRLVEDFMLLANHLIARTATERDVPLLHRVHEEPDTDRIDQLRELLRSVGLRLPRKGKVKPRDLQKVLRSVEGRPEETLVSTVVLRSMKQARYSEQSLGHFGLATRHYTHFTSPIRRYPDLVVHRLAVAAFVEGRSASDLTDTDTLAAIARLSSERERVAVDAERNSVELKKVELMDRHLGEVFEGTISSVTSFGFFVLLKEYFVEGLVHVSSLEDDYYVFQEDRYMLVGEHQKRRFRIGDVVRVQIAAVDIEDRKIDFVLERTG